MDDHPFGIEIAQRLRARFGLGGLASDDFVLVDDGAAQEARFPVIVIEDDFQHEGADLVLVPEEAKDQAIRVVEPRAVKGAMRSARELAHLRRAKITGGDRRHRLAVGGLHPRRVEIGEFENLHGTTCCVGVPAGRSTARIGGSLSAQSE